MTSEDGNRKTSTEAFLLNQLSFLSFQALVPITVDVEVPFDLHRYIIGQKGAGIRKMMEEYEVWGSAPDLFRGEGKGGT